MSIKAQFKDKLLLFSLTGRPYGERETARETDRWGERGRFQERYKQWCSGGRTRVYAVPPLFSEGERIPPLFCFTKIQIKKARGFNCLVSRLYYFVAGFHSYAECAGYFKYLARPRSQSVKRDETRLRDSPTGTTNHKLGISSNHDPRISTNQKLRISTNHELEISTNYETTISTNQKLRILTNDEPRVTAVSPRTSRATNRVSSFK